MTTSMPVRQSASWSGALEAGHGGGGVAVGEVGGHAGGADDVEEVQLLDLGVLLHEQGERLADAAVGAEDGHVAGVPGSDPGDAGDHGAVVWWWRFDFFFFPRKFQEKVFLF